MYRLGINFDEISDDLEVAFDIMERNDIYCGELRTLNKKNFVFWTDEEVLTFKKRLDQTDVELIAAATPLFKWYVNQDDPEIIHDSFGFNPRLDDTEKRSVIERTIDVATTLGIPRLRIFSGLGKTQNAGATFATDPLLAYALDLADSAGIDLYLENEPPCRVHTQKEILALLANNSHPRLKFWLDIANMIEIGEDIDTQFLSQVSSRIGYVHVKDYVREDGVRKYVPAGEGVIDYTTILKDVFASTDNDLVITIETHAPADKKVDYSERSIEGTRRILSSFTQE